MTKRSPIDIVQNLARQRGRGDHTPLLLLHNFEGRSGARISHLPISQHLSEAWIKLTSSPFRPHQSLALSSLRRNEPFALTGSRTATRQTLHLLIHEVLLNDPNARALLLLPDDTTAATHLKDIDHLNQSLGQPLTAAHVDITTPARRVARARTILTTPDVLHKRMLRHHDRAWHSFWSHLQIIFIADADHYSGVAAAHLARLLLRTLRLVPPDIHPLVAATLIDAMNADVALAALNGEEWRVISADDMPRPDTMLAIWQAGSDRLYDTAALALALHREGYCVHITCQRLEIPLLLPLVGSDAERIGIGPVADAAQVQIFTGYPDSYAALRQSLASDTRLTLLVLGNLPAERTLARQPEMLVNDPPPTWVFSSTNAYVAAQHLLCAAAERPLTSAEITAWQANEMVNRLEQHNRLVRLPDDNAAWMPLPSPHTIDPYEYDCFWLEAEGSSVVFLRSDQGILPGTLDPAAFDRWGFPGAALPPGRGGYRVVERDDETSTLTIQIDQQGRNTFPLRTCEIITRDERARRTLRKHHIGWGRIVIDEEIYAYREAVADHTPSDHDLVPSLATRWSAPAIWIDLPMRLKSTGQLVGWSLVAALPLRALCRSTDIVPAYDAGLGRLYLVDAQPGGNGISAWVYEYLEMLLPLAYDIALDSRSSALFEPAARLDMDWLLALLGGEVALPETSPDPPASNRPRETSSSQVSEAVRQTSVTAASNHTSRPPSHTSVQHSERVPVNHTSTAPSNRLITGTQRHQSDAAAELPVTPGNHQHQKHGRASHSNSADTSTRAERYEPPTPSTRYEEPTSIRQPNHTTPAWLPRANPSSAPEEPDQPDQDNTLQHWDDTAPAWLPRAPTVSPEEQAAARDLHAGKQEQPQPATDTVPTVSASQGQQTSIHATDAPTDENAAEEPARKPSATTSKRKRRSESKAESSAEPNATAAGKRTRRTVATSDDNTDTASGTTTTSKRTRRSTSAARQSATKRKQPDANEEPNLPTTTAPSKPVRNTEPPPTYEETPPDPAAILERLQRLREKREATAQTSSASPKKPRHSAPQFEVQQRFQAGDEVFCRPYGYGVVQISRIEDDHEILSVEFADYGAIEIDPMVSMVRHAERTTGREEEL